MQTIQELRLLQALPLEIKVLKTKQRIREWVDRFGVDGVYVSFSGGKDSTVLLHIVRELYPDIEAVFVDTGLEYPEIRKFVKGFENVTWLRPKMRFDEVIKKYGYPFISKEVAKMVFETRKNGNCRDAQKFDINSKYNKKYKNRFSLARYIQMLTVNFIISHNCCKIMKKDPMHNIKKKPILALMASEGALREQLWLKSGCNAFNNKKQQSQPMSFWLNEDVLQYIKLNNLEICSVYGEICETDKQGNLVAEGCGVKLTCSGCQRTGCVFCGFGAHLDTRNGGTSRFVRLKQTHPKLYDYCMNGGEFVDGIWQPNKQGLGMRYIIDELNKLYSKTLKNGTVKKFIEY